MNAQLQIRQNEGEQLNVFPTLGANSAGSTFAAPVALNITHRRQLHNVNVNFSRTRSQGLNRYAFLENVAADAGITGVAADPFDWGVPALSFSSLSACGIRLPPSAATRG